jgi:suppressor for copper-sensitivity B
LLPVAAANASGASDWVRTEQSAVRLISATAAVGRAPELRAGLEFELQPGWKTYWRSPGDAGFPVSVDWSDSVNVAEATLSWPVPHRFSLFGLDTFGYENHVVFPVDVRPAAFDEPVLLDAKVSYLVCEDICIPYDAHVSLQLPIGEAAPTDHAQSINRFAAQVPGDGARHGLTLERVALTGTDAARRLEVVAKSAIESFDKPDLIVEAPPGLYFPAPMTTILSGGTRVAFAIAIETDEHAPRLEEAALTLTLVDGQRGLEQEVVAGVGIGSSVPAARTAAMPSFIAMLVAALLGGIILNVMPCVLPVLSLKLLGLVGHDGEDRRHLRLSFLASAAGILTAFAALAGALAALKAGGAMVGWGIQFQQPWFLVAMTLVLTIFAANLWGWFEVPLPATIGRLAGIGGHSSVAGQFATGVFATLLATPCSAPFVGTAVAFALARGPVEIFAIFLALGLGFAAPYLLVAALPAVARVLPRPGAWMIWLRRVLGLLLAGTAVWLLSILAAMLEPAALWLTVALIAGMGASLWVRHRLPEGLRAVAPVGVLLFAVGALTLPAQIAASRAIDAVELPSGFWAAFDESSIAALVGEGKTVFVDVTADWCVTCIVNKRLVVESAAVNARLTGPDVVPMQADWTRPDDRIARYLAANQRYGIPFNAVYGPRAPEGILLPELLTERAVLEALDRAAGS